MIFLYTWYGIEKDDFIFKYFIAFLDLINVFFDTLHYVPLLIPLSVNYNIISYTNDTFII